MKICMSRWLAAASLAVALAVPAIAQNAPSRDQSSESAAQQAQTSQPEPQDQTMPSASDKSSAQAGAMQEQGFAGKITKSKDGMVLRDPTNHTTYKLDDAEKARQFLGKNVTVTGTLDQASKTIHVSNIEPAPTF